MQTGSTPVTTQFTLPAGVVNGAYRVQVATNGVTSPAVLDVLMDSSLTDVTLTVNGSNSSLYDVYNGGTLLSQWSISSFTAVMVTMRWGDADYLLHTSGDDRQRQRRQRQPRPALSAP